jgi:hypothetical protein
MSYTARFYALKNARFTWPPIVGMLRRMCGLAMRRLWWSVDLHHDVLPHSWHSPVGLACNLQAARANGWLPLQREFDGTVLVIVFRRPSPNVVQHIEKCLSGDPYRIEAAPPGQNPEHFSIDAA